MPQDYYPSGPFLSQLPDRWDFDVLREDFLLGFAVRTARAYKADLEDFREWCDAEGVDPLVPPPGDLERYLAYVGARGYSEATVRRRAVTLRAFLGHLVAIGRLESSPVGNAWSVRRRGPDLQAGADR